MVRLFSLFLYNLILLINFLFNFRKSNNLIYNLKNKLENKNYLKLKIENSFINFYAPNEICRWRYNTIFTKEPETLDWINNFINKNNLIFWDIGANVGIYSIYSVVKHNNIKVVAFEPSTSNLRVLSRNISINNFSNKIIINQTPLFDKDFGFQKLNEEGFNEGGALNAFSVDYGYDGKIDGVWGDKTYFALLSYQDAHIKLEESSFFNGIKKIVANFRNCDEVLDQILE